MIEAQSFNMMVLSDTHLLAPQLGDGGAAMTKAESNNPGMMARSDEIMAAVCDSIVAARPRVVLITGDLTRNGELLSHQRMVEHLQRLRQAGITVLVVPGNHDVNNPGAVGYRGEERVPTPTVTRDEFRSLYADFGYGGTNPQDTASLSYACELAPDVLLLALDTNRDEENTLIGRGDSANTYHNAGRIKAATLQWAVEQATRARARGQRVMAMMHHHLAPHFDAEPQLLSSYIVAGHDEACRALRAAGVEVVFTGHLHVGDIATLQMDCGTMTDVATASLTTYPFSWREVVVAPGELRVSTHRLDALPSCSELRSVGRKKIEAAAPMFVDRLSGRLWKKLERALPAMQRYATAGGRLPADKRQLAALLHPCFDDLAVTAVMAVVEGDEAATSVATEVLTRARDCVNGLKQSMLNDKGREMADFIIAEAMPVVERHVMSVLADRNQAGTPHERVTPDNTAVIPFGR